MGRTGRRGTTLLVIVLVLLGVLVAADRVAARVAEDRIAAQAAPKLANYHVTGGGQPDVKIGGFPFLTQVLAGRYDKVTIDVAHPEVDGIQLGRFMLEATTVQVDNGALLNGTRRATAGRVTGTATMGWDAVRLAMDFANLPGIDPSKLQVSVVDNRLDLKMPLAVLGMQTTLHATGELQLVDGSVKLRVDSINTENPALPGAAQSALNQIRRTFTPTLRIPAMPYQLVINSVTTGPSGVEIVASAEHVQLVD